jgi:hypothetical protein
MLLNTHMHTAQYASSPSKPVTADRSRLDNAAEISNGGVPIGGEVVMRSQLLKSIHRLRPVHPGAREVVDT